MPRKPRSTASDTDTPKPSRRKRVRQSDVPSVSLERALRVPRAIADAYAKQPTRPIDVAAAIGMSPTSSTFPVICGAAIGYGLTDGGSSAQTISLTPLGARIVSPTVEGDDEAAMREAVLTPTVEKRFLEKYDGSPLPPENIAHNILASFGVPADAAARVYSIIRENADRVGVITTIKGKACVNIGRPSKISTQREYPPIGEAASVQPDGLALNTQPAETPIDAVSVPPVQPQNNRVFISHGKDLTVVGQIKDLLEVVGLDPVVAIDEESTSKPLSEKVMDDLLSCSAGIIHVRPERRLRDANGGEHVILNQNVLIEIGAALAHFHDRFILLVEEGTELPSNIGGLYEVRYSGDELGHGAIMKVLKALKKFDGSE